MKSLLLSFLLFPTLLSLKAQYDKPNAQSGGKMRDTLSSGMGPVIIQPIEHATLMITVSGITIYVDPSNAELFAGLTPPDIILVTDIHGDHFNEKALSTLRKGKTKIVVPPAVDALMKQDKSQNVVLKNDEETKISGITIRAIPMYNLPQSDTAKHTKGRGNGYVLNIGGKLFYISGDTQGIPEMRALKNIDVAFICMNLPYTMDVPEAASAVLEFKPKIVYPYHYRGQNGLSDVQDFKTRVEAGDKNIEVRLRIWYPTRE